MKILFIGNSKFFNSRIKKTLDANKKFKYIIASKSAKKYNQKIPYNEYSEALKNCKCDVVYISLINKLHYKYCLLALKMKLNVIVDKPLSLSAKDCLNLLKIAKKNNVLLAEATIFNYHKIFHFIHKYTNSFRLVSRINVDFNIPRNLSNKEMKQNKLDCLSDMSSYAAAINRIFFNTNILEKNIYFEKYKPSKFIKKFNFHIAYKNNKFFNCNFAYGSEYISSIKFFCNNFILEIPFQAFAMRNKYYYLFIKKNNIITKKKYRGDVVLNFFNLIKKCLKNKNFKFFYDTIETDIKFKKTLGLFNE